MKEKKFDWGYFLRHIAIIAVPVALQNLLTTTAVSYTHLDVYKRQVHDGPGKTGLQHTDFWGMWSSDGCISGRTGCLLYTS